MEGPRLARCHGEGAGIRHVRTARMVRKGLLRSTWRVERRNCQRHHEGVQEHLDCLPQPARIGHYGTRVFVQRLPGEIEVVLEGCQGS